MGTGKLAIRQILTAEFGCGRGGESHNRNEEPRRGFLERKTPGPQDNKGHTRLSWTRNVGSSTREGEGDEKGVWFYRSEQTLTGD